MIEPLDENARDWLKSSKEMDSDYANQVDEYIGSLEKQIITYNGTIKQLKEIIKKLMEIIDRVEKLL